MKKNVVLIFVLMALAVSVSSQIQGYKTVTSPSEKDCSIETCLEKCVNAKSICSIWNRGGYIAAYYKAIELNKHFADIDKIKVGDSIIFPPFRSWDKPIGVKAILVVKKDESVWTLVHRYLSENYLLNFSVAYRQITNHACIPEDRAMFFGSTTIIW